MEQLRKSIAAISTYLGALDSTRKLLLGALAVIGVMALLLVSQYASRPSWVELMPGMSGEEQQRAQEFLDSSGIEYVRRDGLIMVPPDDRRTVQAQLAEAGKMPADTTLLFRNIIDRQSWQLSRRQNDQLYAIALQNELSRVISSIKGVRDATVLIDNPERQGLGRAATRPTAAVTVFTTNGQPVPQGAVDAIAGLIAGAVTGLEASNVRVIDGSSGRQRTPTTDEQVLPTTYLEQAARVEAQMQLKINELLSFIPGRVVAVTAQVDVTRQTSLVKRHLDKGDGSVTMVKRQSETSNESGEEIAAAEAGVRSNQALDLNSTPPAGSNTTMSQEERDFENFIGTRTEEISDPRGMPTRLFVSINVPRSYIVALLSKPGANGVAAAEPTDDEITKKFEEVVKPRIIESVTPHVRAMTAAPVSGAPDQAAPSLEGQLAVSLMPGDTLAMTAGLSGSGVLGSGSGGISSTLLADGLIERVALGGLAILSMGMMYFLVRKSSRRAEQPTAEELVGVPPLESGSDVMGEAEEGTTPLAGIEINESEMEAQNMLDQVGELVQNSPESAAALVQRWIAAEE